MLNTIYCYKMAIKYAVLYFLAICFRSSRFVAGPLAKYNCCRSCYGCHGSIPVKCAISFALIHKLVAN